jgi:hypothetical protein
VVGARQGSEHQQASGRRGELVVGMSSVGEAAAHLSSALESTGQAMTGLRVASNAVDEAARLLIEALDGVTRSEAEEAIDAVEAARLLLDDVVGLIRRGDDLVREYAGDVLRVELGDAASAVPDPRTGGAPVVPEVRPRPRDLGDYEQQEKWAWESYAAIRADPDDVSTMTDHLAKVARPSGGAGFSREELAQVKDHLFVQKHSIEDYETGEVVSRRFDPDEEIAAAWIRLRSGQERPSDLVLLEHELTESRYLKANQGAAYQEAHRYANRRYNWNSLIRNG